MQIILDTTIRTKIYSKEMSENCDLIEVLTKNKIAIVHTLRYHATNEWLVYGVQAYADLRYSLRVIEGCYDYYKIDKFIEMYKNNLFDFFN